MWGFGISSPAHARQVAQDGADGVIIGSRIVKIIEENAATKTITAVSSLNLSRRPQGIARGQPDQLIPGHSAGAVTQQRQSGDTAAISRLLSAVACRPCERTPAAGGRPLCDSLWP